MDQKLDDQFLVSQSFVSSLLSKVAETTPSDFIHH